MLSKQPPSYLSSLSIADQRTTSHICTLPLRNQTCLHKQFYFPETDRASSTPDKIIWKWEIFTSETSIQSNSACPSSICSSFAEPTASASVGGYTPAGPRTRLPKTDAHRAAACGKRSSTERHLSLSLSLSPTETATSGLTTCRRPPYLG